MKTLSGCAYALLAYSYFRWRHSKTPRFKSGRRTYLMDSQFKAMTDIARDYIRKAREGGWRGSFREAAAEWESVKHLYR